MSNGTSKLGRDSPEGHAFQRRANTRDERAAWERIGVNEGRARTVFDLAGSAGCELWLNGPSLEIDIPPLCRKSCATVSFCTSFWTVALSPRSLKRRARRYD